MLALFIVYLLCGIIIIILSIPLLSGKIPPNHWYGLRVRETLNDKIVWYKANKISGRYLLIYGICIILLTNVLTILQVGEFTFLITMSVTIFVGAIVFGVTSNKAAVKLSKEIRLK